MSIVSLDLAMSHLKAEPEDQDLVASKLAGAVEIAEQYMGRRIFADSATLKAAQVEAVALLPSVMKVDNSPALTPEEIVVKQFNAEMNQSQLHQLNMIIRGVVINPAIEVAILLILGTLYAYREDIVDGPVAEIPMAATSRLQPFRVMGV